MRLLVFSIFLIGILIVFAQPTRDQHPLSQILANTSVYVIEKDNSETIVKGSKYFSEDFNPGWILLKNSEDTTQNLNLRFNIYHNVLEWRMSESEIRTLLIDRIESFRIKGDLFVNNQQKGFLRSIYNGEFISIYAKVSIKRKDIKAKPPFEEENTILFYEAIDTYIQYKTRLHSINTKKELVILLDDWEIKSLKFKKSDLQNDIFLQSLGKKVDDHLR